MPLLLWLMLFSIPFQLFSAADNDLSDAKRSLQISNENMDNPKFIIYNLNDGRRVGLQDKFEQNSKTMIERGLYHQMEEKDKQELLTSAASNSTLDFVTFLFDQQDQGKLNLHFGNDQNQNPLHWAACGQFDVLRYLLDMRTFDVNQVAIKGRTPLATTLRMVSGARKKTKHTKYFTPFEGCRRIRLYSQYGADLNIKDDEEKTPLHWSIKHHISIMSTLLECGANPNIADNDGYTVLKSLYDGLGRGRNDKSPKQRLLKQYGALFRVPRRK